MSHQIADADQNALAHEVVWMTNQSPDGDWRFISVSPVVRAVLPHHIYVGNLHFAWRITDKAGVSLVYSAVRNGVWLSDKHIRMLCARFRVTLPTQGTGKRGNVLKVDRARVLVYHMFGFANIPREELKKMILGITYKGGKPLKDQEKAILEMVAQLDEENRDCPEFKRVAKLAHQQLKQREKSEVEKEMREMIEKERKSEEEQKKLAEEAAKKAALEQQARDVQPRQEPSSSSHSRKPSATPKALKDFLTHQMFLNKISLNRDPKSYGYRAYYPSSLAGRSGLLRSFRQTLQQKQS